MDQQLLTPIRPLAWEPPYAMGAALKKKKERKKEKEKNNINLSILADENLSSANQKKNVSQKKIDTIILKTNI